MRLDYDVYLRGEQKNKKLEFMFYDSASRFQAITTYFKTRTSSKSVDRWGSSER